MRTFSPQRKNLQFRSAQNSLSFFFIIILPALFQAAVSTQSSFFSLQNNTKKVGAFHDGCEARRPVVGGAFNGRAAKVSDRVSSPSWGLLIAPLNE